jgi:hypothetical protein
MTSTPISSGAEGYADGRSVAAAIKAAAQAARASHIAADGQSPSVDSLITQTTFDRFLSRIFSVPDAGFVLKGGTGMLARIPRARATQDIDLAARSQSLDGAVAELISLAQIDLDDHFSFTFAGRQDQIEGDNQPYTSGCRVTFTAFLGATARGTVKIDLAVGYSHTAPLDLQSPTNRLSRLRLRSYDYILYPLPDQIADKVCATLQLYGAAQRPSSRVKDLVDLAMIAIAEPIDAAQLRAALLAETARRSMGHVAAFAIPATWGPHYPGLARNTPSGSTRPDSPEREHDRGVDDRPGPRGNDHQWSLGSARSALEHGRTLKCAAW